MSISANPLPALLPAEFEALKASILRDGFLSPVIVSAGPANMGEVVDGFNREKIGKEIGIDPPRVSRQFNSEAEFRIAQIDANLQRRHLTMPQRILLAMAREPWEKRLAKARMAEGRVADSRHAGEGKLRATALAAEAVGLKRDTYEHGKFVLQEAPADIRAAFLEGSLSVDRAFKAARRATGRDASSVVASSVAKRFGRMPTGSYGAIVMLPPWRTAARAHEAGRVLPAELAALDVRSLAGKDAVLVIVAPGRWLREALELVAASYGASIVSVLARVRPSSTPGVPLAQRAEFGIVGALGNPKLPDIGRDNLVESDAQLFGLVDALVPERPGIVLFGSVSRPGWSSWAPSFK